MKDHCIKNFSFLPSDYDCMIVYLNEMLEKGYRLKWVKAGFAGFEKLSHGEHITYVIEPYANTSLISLRRLSHTWLNFYTGNDWYFIGKSRGNYIYFTKNEQPKPPSSTSSLAVNDSKERVIATELKRNAGILVIIGFLLYKLLGSKAFMYAFVLTDFYQYLAVIAAVLAFSSVAAILLYALETTRLQLKSFVPGTETGLRFGLLYHIRNTAVAVLALVFFIIDNAAHPLMLLYLLLPVAALAAGGALIAYAAGKNDNAHGTARKIMPYAYAVGGISLILLIFSMNRIQGLRSDIAKEDYARELDFAETLPHINYSDVFGGVYSSRVKTNISHLGSNYLYEEADDSREHIIFTNTCSMRTQSAADRIYDYLFDQAEKDYSGSFEYIDISESEAHDKAADLSICTIPKHNAYLIRSGNTVILTTVTGENIDPDRLRSLAAGLCNELMQ